MVRFTAARSIRGSPQELRNFRADAARTLRRRERLKTVKPLWSLLLAVRESFWLVPAIALAIAVALAIALVHYELADISFAERWPRLFGAGAEGTRGMLTAIAGSMITVAGVVFSVTIVALSLAADAYSPRVLRTFMRDRPTQACFGVFVGVFAYCLVVLRTVRAADENGDGGFVPPLAVFGALVLALVGVAALVYFIHHVAVMIQVPTILERIARDAREAIDALFPEPLGEGEDDAPGEPIAERAWRPLPAARSGYIVTVDNAGLLAFARRRGAVLRMELGVGEFAVESQTLASIAAAEERVAGSDAAALERLYTLGAERSVEQDAAFGIQQIVDVATRALSPGINDPSTAAMCIDQLSALLVRLARRRIPSRLRTEAGELRVIARGPTFESLSTLAFETLAPHARGKRPVLESLARAARAVERAAPPARAAFMARHREAIEARLRECEVAL